jgi:hypothetical protein
MTSTTNLIQLQSDLKEHVKGEYEFRNTGNGTRIIKKEMADYLAMKDYLEKHNLHYFIFSPNSEKPIKAVICHLPPDTPVEDVSNSLEDLGFNVISVRQLTTNRRAPNGQTHVETLPLYLVTLTRNLKSQEIFKLNSLHHIIIKVGPYRAQTGLTQGYNCQNFGHVWANCRQPPRCLWCGGGHLHRECPEKRNAESTPRYCKCTLVEGEKPHPASYRGCSHAKGELQWRRAQRAPKGPSGRTLFAKFTSAEQAYAAVLRQETQQQQPQAPQTDARSVQHPVQQHLPQQEFQKTDQSVQSPSSSDNDKLKVATVVRQSMRELSEALSEEDRAVIVTIIVLDLMERNGC